MAGLQMPKRGSGAAMLRDLREDERPLLENERPALKGEFPPSDAPRSDNHLEQFTQGEMDQLEAEMNTRENISSQPYDNMTNHMTESLSDKQSDQKTVKQTGKPAKKKTSNTFSQKASQSVGQVAGQSVAEMIRQRAAQRAEPEVLKTVTLKLSPSLDEKIERYCFDQKMKKQEFWAEAAALYFEMITEGETE